METGLIVKVSAITRDGRDVLRDCSFRVRPGELVVVSGPNGAGKSSLLAAIMGYSTMNVVGELTLDGLDLLSLAIYERARRGLFLIHQEPPAIPGVTIAGAIRAQTEALRGSLSIPAIQTEIREACSLLGVDESFSRRPLNDGLSGGEKKRAELVQMLVAKPRYVLVDELDSGLDADMLGRARAIIAELRTQGVGFIVVSHNKAFVDDLVPTLVLNLGSTLQSKVPELL